ncbi:DUF2017 family protein [Micrococcoides hystricis]|uniref:DUF2017 family protein n=1 Tax=Micrococcoides hystricis TaxID=1572761 RepID=A0ABV6PDX4_9MICC
MATEFISSPHGYHSRIDANESRLLQELCDDVVTLLEEDADLRAPGGDSAHPMTDQLFTLTGIDPAEFAELARSFGDSTAQVPEFEMHRPAPTDAAVQNLLPSAHAENGPAAQFRAKHEENLRYQKIADLRTAQIYFASRELYLDEDQAVLVARVLNHLRLTLAARLKIKDEEDAAKIHQIMDSAQAVDPRSYMALIYNFLTWWQDTLTEALLVDLPEEEL